MSITAIKICRVTLSLLPYLLCLMFNGIFNTARFHYIFYYYYYHYHNHYHYFYYYHFMAVTQDNLRSRTGGFCWSKVLQPACPC